MANGSTLRPQLLKEELISSSTMFIAVRKPPSLLLNRAWISLIYPPKRYSWLFSPCWKVSGNWANSSQLVPHCQRSQIPHLSLSTTPFLYLFSLGIKTYSTTVLSFYPPSVSLLCGLVSTWQTTAPSFFLECLGGEELKLGKVVARVIVG